VGVLLIVLAAIALVNFIALVVLTRRAAKHRREREEALTQKAAEQAIEKGLERVRGREWMQAHKP
jgi:flagellar biosynthesis/type III secretory pathway M-ring protein FliF/YscJ